MKKAAFLATLASAAAISLLTPSAEAQFQFAAYLYKHSNFNGSQFVIEADRDYANLGWFNDKASSIRVARGCSITVYYDSDFRGLSKDFPAGDYEFVGESLNDKISSVKAFC